jgi:hypothetical protein
MQIFLPTFRRPSHLCLQIRKVCPAGKSGTDIRIRLPGSLNEERRRRSAKASESLKNGSSSRTERVGERTKLGQ